MKGKNTPEKTKNVFASEIKTTKKGRLVLKIKKY